MAKIVLSYQSQFSTWRLPTDIPDHNGQPIPASAEFFQTPPAEIGILISAHSSLHTNMRHASRMTRVLRRVVVPFLIGLSTWIAARQKANGMEAVIYLLGLIVMLMAFHFGLVRTRFYHICSYVGSLGLAWYTLKGTRGAQIKQKIVLFADAANLRIHQAPHGYQGVDFGDSYEFVWTGPTGLLVLRFEGMRQRDDGKLRQNDLYWFAAATERAWDKFVRSRNEESQEKG